MVEGDRGSCCGGFQRFATTVIGANVFSPVSWNIKKKEKKKESGMPDFQVSQRFASAICFFFLSFLPFFMFFLSVLLRPQRSMYVEV